MDNNKMNEKKKNKIVLFVFLVLVVSAVFVLLNSYVYKGHNITNLYDNKSRGLYEISNLVGYEFNDGQYKVIDDSNHYITIKNNGKDSECLLVFNSCAKSDTNVKVWCMNSDGLILDEYTTVWKKDKRWLFVNEISSEASLISFGIDSDFSIYEAFFSNPFSENIVFFIIVLIVLSITIAGIILLYKKNKLSSVFNLANRLLYYANKISYKKILKLVFLLVAEMILSVVGLVILAESKTKLFNYYIKLNYKTVAILFFAMFIITILVLYRKKLEKNIAIFGALTIFVIGSLYAFLEPASNGVCLDDENHYNKTAGFSHIVDNRRSLSDHLMFNNYIPVINDKITYDKESSIEYFSLYDEVDKEGFFFNEKGYEFTYKRIVYFPLALGLCVARGIGLPYHIQLLVGRWFDIIFLAILSYFAMKKIKYGKIIVLLVALIPTNIFFASGYSYDIWLTGWAMLAFSYLFYEMQTDDYIEKKSIIIMASAFTLAMLQKQVYFLLIFPALFLSNKKFRTSKNNLIYRMIMILIILLPFVFAVVDNMVNVGEGDVRGGPGVNASEQVDYFINNSFQVIKVILVFLKQYLNPLDGGKYYLNYIGYNGLIEGSVVTFVVILLFAFVSHEQKKGAFPIWFRLGILLLYVAVGGICAFSLYIMYTPVGAGYVNGCQARYMLPTIFPVLYVLTRIPVKCNVKNKIGENVVNCLTISGVVLINLYCLTKGCVMLY